MNASTSIDPDFIGTDGMEFVWLCRDVDDQQEFVVSDVNSEPLLAFPPFPNPNVQKTDNATVPNDKNS